jgi:hypothetical protein
LLALCVCSHALADPSPASKPHVDAGVRAYNAGDYTSAIREFETAYGIEPDPVLLYAWAQAQRQGGHCDKAVELYRRYIDSKPTDAQVAAATTGISLCEQTSALPPPGEPPPEPPPPAPQSPWYKDRLAGALVIGGAASLTIGVTFLVLSERSADAATDADARADFLSHLDDATQRRRIGFVGLGIGAALVAGGVYRYVTRGDRTKPTTTVGIASGSLVVFGRF